MGDKDNVSSLSLFLWSLCPRGWHEAGEGADVKKKATKKDKERKEAFLQNCIVVLVKAKIQRGVSRRKASGGGSQHTHTHTQTKENREDYHNSSCAHILSSLNCKKRTCSVSVLTGKGVAESTSLLSSFSSSVLFICCYAFTRIPFSYLTCFIKCYQCKKEQNGSHRCVA